MNLLSSETKIIEGSKRGSNDQAEQGIPSKRFRWENRHYKGEMPLSLQVPPQGKGEEQIEMSRYYPDYVLPLVQDT